MRPIRFTSLSILLFVVATFLAQARSSAPETPPPAQAVPGCPNCNPHVYGKPPWQSRFRPIPLAVGWEAYGEGHAAPGYWRDPHGMVHLRGMARYVGTAPGENGSTYRLGTLPEGFQVAEKEMFPTVFHGIIDLTGDGGIWLSLGFPRAVSLSGITFYAP